MSFLLEIVFFVRERPRPNDVRGLSPLPRAENEVPPKMFMFVYILRVLREKEITVLQ